MDQPTGQQASQTREEQGTTASSASSKAPWQEPMLAFIEPKLTAHGKLEEVTAGFFGGFSETVAVIQSFSGVDDGNLVMSPGEQSIPWRILPCLDPVNTLPT